ncbi:SDR family oxidoreductase, partial [Acinetobacter baumannii]
LAKIFLEKILRLQPKVKKLFLLLRPTTEKSVEQRLQEEIFGSELFRVLKERNGPDANSDLFAKVIPVCGDVANENLGIVGSELRDEMWHEIDIIVNSAATTKFDERYDLALGINAMGTMNVEKFARKCAKIEMLLHVSTAYVSGNKVGLIQEKPFEMGETLPGAKIQYLDINMEKQIVEEKLKELQILNATEKEITRVMKDLGIQRAMLHGWPNTYSFTKAIGEMLLGNFKEKAKVVILRPTIITSTYAEPFPGWIEGLRTLDAIFVTYGRGKLEVFVGDPESTLDMIPGDMVVNSMLAAIASNQDSTKLVVYHVGSSLRNPLKFADIKWIMHRYLTKNPLLDKNRRPIKIGEPVTLDTMDSFRQYFAIHYLPFVKALGLVNMIFCNLFKSLYENATRRIDLIIRLAELYRPYLFFHGIFDDTNTENLRMAIRESKMDMDVLNFDPKCIQWEEYFVNTHFHGIAKYVLK